MSSQSTAKARENFSEILNQVAYGKERVVVTRRGKELAVVIPIEDYRLLQGMEDQIDVADSKKALARVKKDGGVKWEDAKKSLHKKK